MSILGAVVRVHPAKLSATVADLARLPGVDIALNPGDGRIVIVMEDTTSTGDAPEVRSAAATLTEIACWPDVLSTSLVYEYSGPDAPPLVTDDMSDYRAWRGNPASSPQKDFLSIDKPAQQANSTETLI
jgi:nitrate reductase NapAB chaperone NapD